VHLGHNLRFGVEAMPMTFRIERLGSEESVIVLQVSGRVHVECVGTIKELTPIPMVRAFPPQVRFTGVSFSYNIAYAVFGGLTPLVVSWLARADRFQTSTLHRGCNNARSCGYVYDTSDTPSE
jgi:hypothetical protein